MNVANFFRSNSQPTPMQQIIEKATDAGRADEDWDSMMKICDAVTMNDEHAKEAMRVIRKRLQINPATSGWRSISLTLTLLEALTKNCGKRFHLQIAQKDFLREFRSILAPKNSPPSGIQENVLKLIQTWAVAFRDDPDLKNVEQFYQECKQQGIEFPPSDPENVIKAAVSSKPSIETRGNVARPVDQQNSSFQARPSNNEGVIVRQITAEQLAKLRSELDVVQTNGQIFGEMLITLQPAEEHPEDFQLLTDLYQTCKQMQSRIIDLLSQISLDEITVDLLRYNDEFNNSFKNYENYVEERKRRLQASSQNFSTNDSTARNLSSAQRQNEPALIKFEDSENLSAAIENFHFQAKTAEPTTTKISSPPAAASVSSGRNFTEKIPTIENEKSSNIDENLISLSNNQPTTSTENIKTDVEQDNIFHIPTPLINNPDA